MESLIEVNGAKRASRFKPSSRSSSANIVSAHLLLPATSLPLPAKRSTPPGINKDFLCFTFASSVKAEMLLRTRTNQSAPLRESPEWISVLVPRTVGSGSSRQCSQPAGGVPLLHDHLPEVLKSSEWTLEKKVNLSR